MRNRRTYAGAALAIAAMLTPALALQAQGLPVTNDRLLHADKEPGNWLMYGNTYNSWRFSRLDQINTQNVKNLHAKWLFQGHHNEKFETTPLVVDGIMYLTRPENDIFALDAETGRVLWIYSYRNPERTYNCCGKVNRGLAILGRTLYMNTLDMHVVAVDAKSGRELWKTEMYDHTAGGGYAATGAPLVVKDKLIVGVAGAEHPISGFVDAYDTRTGKHVWRFHTIPQPGEPNFGTWGGDTWKTGGASTWNTGSYDPETNTLYWGVGNPWPDHNADERGPGDNLYSCSVVALDPDTGKLKWYFQFTPGDTHDWDSTQIPVLIDGELRGRPRKLLAWPNRNGFFYLLDRTNGEFQFAKAFVKQTWNRGFDDKGRPLIIPGNEATPEGNDRIWPGDDGAANWMAHSYSPITKLLYVAARNERHLYTKEAIRHVTTAPPAGPRARRAPVPDDNSFFDTGGHVAVAANERPGRGPRFAPEESWGMVLAIEPLTGTIKWEHKIVSPPWGGVTSTAGNLVFGGTPEGVIYALDARTGQRLWYFAGNDRIYASPVTYLANGKQYVSLAVGDVIATFALD